MQYDDLVLIYTSEQLEATISMFEAYYPASR
jgi:hypothetical protein